MGIFVSFTGWHDLDGKTTIGDLQAVGTGHPSGGAAGLSGPR
jgi:hypothetical protein